VIICIRQISTSLALSIADHLNSGDIWLLDISMISRTARYTSAFRS